MLDPVAYFPSESPMFFATRRGGVFAASAAMRDSGPRLQGRAGLRLAATVGEAPLCNDDETMVQ